MGRLTGALGGWGSQDPERRESRNQGNDQEVPPRETPETCSRQPMNCKETLDKDTLSFLRPFLFPPKSLSGEEAAGYLELCLFLFAQPVAGGMHTGSGGVEWCSAMGVTGALLAPGLKG
ncbi:hypothetical protein AGOR_G00120520 [Albula goreensis]|uniref:Uncharacterized protein n=1 Tax=Albula goreensis TaxID=1534307 RepID=A0A8T3DFN1_9TELE|nr:hypothetical protein AGOR_G00120520 [Albula goreensis]